MTNMTPINADSTADSTPVDSPELWRDRPENPSDGILPEDAGEDTGEVTGEVTGPDHERPVRPAMLRGWRRKCPNCGTGPLFKGYLKVNDTCPVCRENLSGHRADDGPAYLTILIVGHIMAPLLLVVFEVFRPEPLTLFSVFAVGCTALSLYLLPRLKGAIIGLQWARRMYGFAVPEKPGAKAEGQ